MSGINGSVSRLVFLSGWVAALLVITGRPADHAGSAYAEPPAANIEPVAALSIEASDAAYETEDMGSSPESTACTSWDVSPMAMEAILDEMIRRGWRPPTQGYFLASAAVEDGVEAVDHEATVWADTPHSAPVSGQRHTESQSSLGVATVAVVEAPTTQDVGASGISVTSEPSIGGLDSEREDATAGAPLDP
jgi:hypothetical protein